MLVERWAVVRWQFEAWHRWPGVDLDGERGYLGHSHRHMFHVELGVSTTHNEREIEFHNLLDLGKASQVARIHQRSDMSCETMCDAIGLDIRMVYPERRVKVSVFEDNEVGAQMQWAPTEE